MKDEGLYCEYRENAVAFAEKNNDIKSVAQKFLDIVGRKEDYICAQ
jgi:hypothetical protein